MKKSSVFKKISAIILAGTILSQTGFGHCESPTKYSNKSTIILGTLVGIGAITVLALGGYSIYLSSEIRKKDDIIKKEIEKSQELNKNLNSVRKENERIKGVLNDAYEKAKKAYEISEESLKQR